MCKFFSAISDGKGKVLFFTVEDINKIMLEGNPKSYEWSSHTSIAHYNGILGADEDKWNKWEYNCDKRKLEIDQLNTIDDGERVRPIIEKYLTTENTIYLRNLYMRNSGNSNSGNSNSGYWNSGNNNSGCFNTKTPADILVFNKKCKISIWENARKPNFLFFDLTRWVSFSDMTPEEKNADLLAEMRGGYLKKMEYKEAFQLAYSRASDEDKALLLKLPNFNKKVFCKISGIKV